MPAILATSAIRRFAIIPVLLLAHLQILSPGGGLISDVPAPGALAADTPGRYAPGPTVSAPTPGATYRRVVLGEPAQRNGLVARWHILALSEGIGARVAGTPAEAKAAAYIRLAFETLGYATYVQPFSFSSEDGAGDDITLNSANVIAVKPGQSDETIIVGAHYDSVDAGNGADDNASGVGVMLEVAGQIRDIQTPYTIRFVAFGAEEEDLDGSRHYVADMSEFDIEMTVGMLNLDSLIAGDIAYVYGDAGVPASLRDWILETAHARGLDLQTRSVDELDLPDGSPCDCADYVPFQAAGIPFAYFEATNWELGERDGMTQVAPEFGDAGEIRHTVYDTMGYLDATFPGRSDQRLHLFVTLLHATLSQFNLPPAPNHGARCCRICWVDSIPPPS
jgi:hypothetical protein